MLWLLANTAIGEPVQLDVETYSAWRRDARATLETARAGCPGADTRLRYTLRVLPDGTLTNAHGPAGPPTADLVGTPKTAGFSATERSAAAAAADAAQRCFEGALATVSLPPPGGRGITLPPAWFDFGSRSPAPATPPQAPRLDPPTLDSDEVRNELVAVIWAGEARVLACLPPGHPPVEVRWRLAPTGTVVTVEPVRGVTPEQGSCVQDVVRRWVFPPVAAATDPVLVHYTFDPTL